MMIEISKLRLMLAADIDDCNLRIGQIGSRRIPSHDRNRAHCQQHTAGKKLVLMRTAGMGDDERIFHAGIERNEINTKE